MSNNAAISALKLMIKFFVAILKGIWYVITYGFRAYKKHKSLKEQESQDREM